jgi:hypothetical protein
MDMLKFVYNKILLLSNVEPNLVCEHRVRPGDRALRILIRKIEVHTNAGAARKAKLYRVELVKNEHLWVETPNIIYSYLNVNGKK